MENHIETNFREIQKILDSCIAHDYKTKVDALFLKREYCLCCISLCFIGIRSFFDFFFCKIQRFA